MKIQRQGLSRRLILGGLAGSAVLTSSSFVRAQAKRVVVYTAFVESVNAIAPLFKAKTGLDLEIVAAGSGELVRRVRAESQRPLGDCVVSIGGEGIDAAKELFTPYVTKEDASIRADLKVSPTWVPFSVTLASVLAVNTRLVQAAEIPSSWAELADPKWKGKIAFAGADKSGSALIQMMQIIYTAGDTEKGWELFGKMFENFVVTGSSGAVSRGAAQGEYAIGITLEDNATRFIDGGSPLKVVYPREGISFAADAMALIANGPNAEGAKSLLDFIASAEGQQVIVEKFGRRPIRNDVAAPKGALAAADLPVKNPPVAWSNANSKPFLDRYLRLARR
jgi:iron(III) transport system substrate-binding protein